MLWNASTVNGYAIEASDGRLGTVSDLLFEDVGWTVRWLVVDTGHWLSGRKVLLPLSTLRKPDRAHRRFPVTLTMQQVKDSPDTDWDQPVSRQTEADLYHYYGRDPYWAGGAVSTSGVMAVPPLAPLGPTPRAGDPNLRSVAAVTGYHVHVTDGEIGHVEDFLIDDDTWSLRYVIVDTKNWWPGVRVLISPCSVEEIDWADKLIHVNVNRQKVKDGPPYDPAVTIDETYDETFLTYYGIRWIAA